MSAMQEAAICALVHAGWPIASAGRLAGIEPDAARDVMRKHGLSPASASDGQRVTCALPILAFARLKHHAAARGVTESMLLLMILEQVLAGGSRHESLVDSLLDDGVHT